MTAIYFDTREVAERFRSLGFEPKQANGITDILRDTASSNAENLVTKADLKEVETALRSDLEKGLTALDAKIDKVEATLRVELGYIKWIMGATFAAVFSLVLKAFFL